MAWFKSWFDSNYYPILYSKRNESEAQLFIDNLLDKLSITNPIKVIDIGCGRGRHSVYLNSKGHIVTGIDVSTESIEECRKLENPSLSFYVHDIRNLIRTNYFDLALSIFTSFGYFEKDSDNIKVLLNAKKSLKPGGIFVIDFINAVHTGKNLVQNEVKVIDGIQFNIARSLEKEVISKKIEIIDKENSFNFTEKIHAYTLDSFKTMIDKVQLELLGVFGSYHLDAYDPDNSARMILICRNPLID